MSQKSSCQIFIGPGCIKPWLWWSWL